MDTALIWGTPIPATIRVVQIEPGPMPTFTPSAPASTSANAAEAVAIFPPITCMSGKVVLTQRTRSITPLEWPWAVSTTITSAPALTNADTRSSVSAPVPTAAPTLKRPWLSLHAFGKSCAFLISFTVTSPINSKASFTTNTFSILWVWSSFLITSKSVPSLTVTSFSLGVMISFTWRSRRVSNLISRPVTIPIKSLPSTTGKPEILFAKVISSSSRTVVLGETVIGSLTTPLSYFLTVLTSAACCSMVIFLWIIPMPPSCAIEIARRESVTVSIAAETRGMFNSMSLVILDLSETSLGNTSE